jgi:uncharacterized FlaG/YvyC family protein
MALEDFNMEQDRRLNTAITEVAILKEQVTNTRSSLDEIKKGSEELKRGQTELIAAVAKGNASNDRMEATLKYSINDQIQSALIPVKSDIATLKEESIVRKTQIATWAMVGSGVGASIAVICSILWKIISTAL